MKLSKTEREDLQEFIAERCGRPDWKKPSLLAEHYSDVIGRIFLALAILWVIILFVGILYATLFWGIMLLITLWASWLLFKDTYQRSSDMVRTLGMTLRAVENPTKANSVNVDVPPDPLQRVSKLNAPNDTRPRF